MSFRTPYARDNSRLSELILRRGEQEADAIRRQGEISGQMWSNLGQQIGGTLGDLARHRMDAPRREMEQLQLEGARGEVEAQKTARAQDAAFMRLFDEAGRMPTPDETVRIYGPQRGVQIAQGLAAFDELRTKRVADARSTAGRLALGIKQFSPEMRGQLWPSVRQAVVEGGLGDEQSIPAEPSDEFLDGVIAWSTGQQPTKADGYTLNPGDVRFDARNNQVASVPAKPEKEETFTVTTKGPGGRPVKKMFTRSQLEQGVEEYREPTDTKTPTRFWVMRNGQPVRISEAEYRPGDAPANSREQGRPVTSGDAGRIADLDTALDDLNVLTRDIGLTGTGSAVGAALPKFVTDWTGWGEDSKARQAVIDRVKQVIGKALEGGVLRKEDEEKYKKILPTIGDAPSVAKSKLKGLWEAITDRRQTLIDSLGDAGFDTTKYSARQPRQREEVVPDDVKAALKGMSAGRHTLSDGSVWEIGADGSRRKAK